MRFDLIQSEKRLSSWEVHEIDETLFYPLVHSLMDDDRVEDVRYFIGHPQLDRPSLTINVSKGTDPAVILPETCSGLAKKFRDLRTQVKKAL